MDCDHRDEENCSHRQTNQGHQSSQQNGEPTDELDQNGKPGHEVRSGYADCMQDGGEGFSAFRELGEAMLHKAISNNQPERNRCPASY
jgi:hypothetical protein